MTTNAPSPATLLAGLDANALWARGWPQRHFLVEDALTRLPALLQDFAAQPIQALFDRYRGRLSFGRGARSVQSLDSAAHPAHLFAMGLTVYLHDLTPWFAELPALLLQMEQQLLLPKGSARITAFASPQGDGLPAHFDGEDVISIQLQGRKRFRVAPVAGLPAPLGPQFGPGMLPADELYPQCPEGFPNDIPADAEVITMRPGSILFLPRGIWHQTLALEDSLSLSLVLRTPTLADALLRELRPLLLADPAWRRPLHGATAPDSAQGSDLLKQAGALLDRLPALAAQLSAAALLRTDDEQRLQQIDARTRFQRIPGASLDLEPAAPGALTLTVRARDADWIERTTLQRPVGAALAPALRWLSARDAAFDLATLQREVPGLRADSGPPLLAGLVQAGLLKLLS
ncbi:cupin domain-containing protein [Paucibacter sp. R3-3]|uniref:Cupin domain-containing protein n=1 Tax=Roseateles agri TaxID=3098619 RepID=A0ABU5DPV9_9BURK|nr:cupin domain-containing protein [Paucibacter sp. R3-3]MDY0747675.1 cupin domain-containing protein [Paucibacter sp. R3-3]